MVRGTFSPARAWRPAVVYRLAQTLGSAGQAVQYSSRISALRRGLNSHEAAKPRTANNPQQRPWSLTIVGCERTLPHRVSVGFIRQSGTVLASIVQARTTKTWRHFARSPHLPAREALIFGQFVGALHPTGQTFIDHQSRRLQFLARQGLRRGARSTCCGVRGVTMPWRAQHQRSLGAALPNPSLNRSANGRPPGPGWWYAVHFHQPGPGVLPSATG